ncbi:MAG: hypothetical protein GWN87_28775, partial [Desulfuromonadales bacterium]|nr:hypothetical protein [Desulfuromonadales bacterium]NIS39926.1 hypothetical protein [Desulfuromonadales bacterium]
MEPLKTATPRAQPKREEMVDIEMIDEETYEEELRKSRPSEAAGKEEASSAADVAAIFRAYDIRG